jgi:hypothetical protein
MKSAVLTLLGLSLSVSALAGTRNPIREDLENAGLKPSVSSANPFLTSVLEVKLENLADTPYLASLLPKDSPLGSAIGGGERTVYFVESVPTSRLTQSSASRVSIAGIYGLTAAIGSVLPNGRKVGLWVYGCDTDSYSVFGDFNRKAQDYELYDSNGTVVLHGDRTALECSADLGDGVNQLSVGELSFMKGLLSRTNSPTCSDARQRVAAALRTIPAERDCKDGLFDVRFRSDDRPSIAFVDGTPYEDGFRASAFFQDFKQDQAESTFCPNALALAEDAYHSDLNVRRDDLKARRDSIATEKRLKYAASESHRGKSVHEGTGRRGDGSF